MTAVVKIQIPSPARVVRGKVFRNEAFDNRFHKPTIDWQLATQSHCKPATAQPFINRITLKQ